MWQVKKEREQINIRIFSFMCLINFIHWNHLILCARATNKNRRFVLINVFFHIIILFAKQQHLNQTIHHKLIFLSWSLPSLTSLNWIVTMAWTEVSRDFFVVHLLFISAEQKNKCFILTVWRLKFPLAEWGKHGQMKNCKICYTISPASNVFFWWKCQKEKTIAKIPR